MALNRNSTGKTQTESPSALFGGESGAEYRTLQRRSHALAVVFDIDNYLVAMAQRPHLNAAFLVGQGINSIAN